MFQVYFDYIKNLVMKYIYFKYTSNLFLNISLMTQKLKTYKIHVFIVKL